MTGKTTDVEGCTFSFHRGSNHGWSRELPRKKGLDYHPGSEYSTADVRFVGIFHRIITIAVELSCGSLNRF